MPLRPAMRSLLLTNLFIVFLPVLMLQLSAPTFMRGRTSPIPGGALLGAVVVLLAIAGSFRVAATRARRVIGGPGTESPGETVALASAALVLVLLGQSLLSGLAEAIGVIRQAPPGSPMPFTLDYPRYALITVLAYAWTVSVLTLLTVGLASGRAGLRAEALRIQWPGQAKMAALGVAAAAVVVLGLKVLQHLGP